MHIDTALSTQRRGTDVALEIRPQTSKHQFPRNSKVVLFAFNLSLNINEEQDKTREKKTV